MSAVLAAALCVGPLRLHPAVEPPPLSCLTPHPLHISGCRLHLCQRVGPQGVHHLLHPLHRLHHPHHRDRLHHHRAHVLPAGGGGPQVGWGGAGCGGAGRGGVRWSGAGRGGRAWLAASGAMSGSSSSSSSSSRGPLQAEPVRMRLAWACLHASCASHFIGCTRAAASLPFPPPPACRRWWWRSIMCGGSTALFIYGELQGRDWELQLGLQSLLARDLA